MNLPSGEGEHKNASSETYEANHHIFSTFCSCFVSRQRNTLRGKLYLPSCVYMNWIGTQEWLVFIFYWQVRENLPSFTPREHGQFWSLDSIISRSVAPLKSCKTKTFGILAFFPHKKINKTYNLYIHSFIPYSSAAQLKFMKVELHSGKFFNYKGPDKQLTWLTTNNSYLNHEWLFVKSN